jgi:DivIVA domain-containing protein
MRLTPAEVHNVVFKKPAIGKRGYDDDEVDAFLDLVEDELTRLIEENNGLRARVAELESSGVQAAVPQPVPAPQFEPEPIPEPEPEAQPEPEHPEPVEQRPAAPAPAPDTHVQAARMLGLAQEMADRLTSEARGDAEQMRATAQAEAERLRAESWAQAEQVRAQAAAEAEARERAGQQQYDEIIGNLTTQRAELQKKIDDLRVYEREYRSRLRSWITDQLALIDGERSDS